MTTYSYRLNTPSVQETVGGVEFTAAVNVDYDADNLVLNQFVPDRLDRYVDGVLTNTDLVTPFTPTAHEVYHNPGYRLTQEAALAAVPGVVAISANVTLSLANKATYNGKTLVWSGAYTFTIPVGMGDFGFVGEPPASGVASIISDGTVLLNGYTTTQTRSAGFTFAVYNIGTDTYRVTGG